MTQQATEAPWGIPYHVFNPLNKPVEELPYIFGFNNGGSEGWWIAMAVSQNGHFLGSHVCSSEGFMPADLGLIDGGYVARREAYQKHYPEGYRTTFVSYKDVKDNAELQAAMTIFVGRQAKAAAEREEAEKVRLAAEQGENNDD